jgi:hypothetical protein
MFAQQARPPGGKGRGAPHQRQLPTTNPLCPCLADLSQFGLLGDLIANVNGKRYNLGPDYGVGSCAAHDERPSGRFHKCPAVS